MAIDTYALYRQLAEERPIKARRYQRSITETLERPTIHELERERLTQALAGIADGLAGHPICGRCGRELTDPESVALGLGPDCAELVAS